MTGGVIDDPRSPSLPSRRLLGCCALVLAVMLLATGCALPRTAATTLRDAEIPAEVVWERDLPVVGGVVATEDVAVTYIAADDGTLTLVGLSTADGSTLWQHEAGRGAVRPSLSEIRPAVFSDSNGVYVGFLEEDSRSTSTSRSVNRVAIVDVDSGEIVARTSERTWVYTSPERCLDRAAVCMKVVDGGRHFRAYFTATSTRLRKHPQQESAHAGDVAVRFVDEGDWDVFRVSDEETLWTLRLSELPGASRELDVRLTMPPEETPWRQIGTRDSGGISIEDSEDPDTLDLAKQNLYLLDAGSGEVLWWGSGYAYTCPHDYLVAGVRCRATGVEHVVDGGPNDYQDLDLVLEGFDVDGVTTWELPLGDDQSALAPGPPSLGSDLVVPTRGGALLLDPATGATRPVPATWTYLCGEEAEIGHVLHWDVAEPEEDTWLGGTVYTTCRADGTEIEGAPSVAAVRAVGVGVGNVTLVAHPRRLVAYEVD